MEEELTNWDLLLVTTKKFNGADWNKTGFTIGLYLEGNIYDAQALEDYDTGLEMWNIDDYVESVSKIGKYES